MLFNRQKVTQGVLAIQPVNANIRTAASEGTALRINPLIG